MIVCGFDLATTTGAAALDGTKVLSAVSFRARGLDDSTVFNSFRYWFRDFIEDHGARAVAIEQPLRTPSIDKYGELSPKSQMSTYLRLYGLRAHALEVCKSLNVTCHEVNQMTWRKAFAGSGRADKQASLAIAQKLLPGLVSLDAAEAIGVAWWLNGELSKQDLFAREVAA
jgi:Holliday junction resolvasome RuvABC endonuclease subunit